MKQCEECGADTNITAIEDFAAEKVEAHILCADCTKKWGEEKILAVAQEAE